jgi:hypothetical protein
MQRHFVTNTNEVMQEERKQFWRGIQEKTFLHERNKQINHLITDNKLWPLAKGSSV